MKKKILLVDDNPIHAASAYDQLHEDHELTIVGPTNRSLADYMRLATLKKKGAYGDVWERRIEQVKRYAFQSAQELILKNPGGYDVVLLDLSMPANTANQAHDYKNKGDADPYNIEHPFGIILALLAVKHGAKFVAVFTDADHHENPFSNALDSLNPDGETNPSSFEIEGAKVIFTNNRAWIDTQESEEYKVISPNGRVKIKRWDKLLKYLLK